MFILQHDFLYTYIQSGIILYFKSFLYNEVKYGGVNFFVEFITSFWLINFLI